MPTKEIKYGQDSREAILAGVNAIANAVKVSLGAKGRTVVIGRRHNSEITKDGITIAHSIQLEDKIECISGNIIKEVSQKTVLAAGDGTTTAMILAQAIVQEGFKLIAAGINPMDVKRGVDKAVVCIVEHLKEIAEPIDINSEKLNQIAAISANNDSVVGDFVASVFKKVGIDGVIGIERSNTYETHTEVKDGLQINTGYNSPYFVNDLENYTCQLENPYIIVSEGKISTKRDIFVLLEKVIKEQRSLLVIAEDIEGEALHILIANKMKAIYNGKPGYPICAIKAPGFGDAKKDFIKDISIIVGANVANDTSGLRTDTLKLTDLGTAEKVLITKDETTILGGAGNKIDIDAQELYIRKRIEDSKNDFEKKLYESRLAKLIGGIGIIFIGATTEIEYKELAARYDDALRATKAAVDEGIVCGGGIALIRCIDKLNDLKHHNEDEKSGIKLMQKVLETPFRQMAINAGIDISVEKIKEAGDNNGYNFKTDKYEDLVIAGVIDPVKVIRVALQNAASVGGTLITSEVLTVNEEEPIPNMQQRR